MIDKTAAVYICRLCRRLSVLTDLAAALEQVSKGNPVDLADIPHATELPATNANSCEPPLKTS